MRIPAAMRPMAELASGERAHAFVHGLTLAHMDATLRGLMPRSVSWQVMSKPNSPKLALTRSRTGRNQNDTHPLLSMA